MSYANVILDKLPEEIGLNDKLVLALLNSVPVGISIATDTSCRVIRHNPFASDFYRSKPWSNISHSSPGSLPYKMLYKGKVMIPEEMPIQRAAWYGVVTRGQEIEYLWEDGVCKYALFNSSPIINDEGEIIGAVATFEDITVRKQAGDSLREREEQLRQITGNMRDLIIKVDTNGIVMYISPSFESIMGYGIKERLGKSIFKTIHPDDTGRVRFLFEEVSARKLKAGKVEYRHRHTDGHYLWLEAVAKALRDDKGNVIGVVLGIRDITERKRMEDELRKSGQQINDILESITYAFYAVDADWRLTYINRKTKDLLKHCGEELIGKLVYEIFPSEIARRQEHDRAMRERISLNYETFSPDLSAWIGANIYPTSDGGLSVYFRDITERKQAEKEIQRSRQEIIDILESIADCFYALDPELRFIYANRATEKITGVPVKTVVGKKLEEAFPNISPVTLEKYRTALREKTPQNYEVFSQITGKWHDVSVYPTQEGISIYFRDITERKQIEQKLQINQQRLEALLKLNRMSGATIKEIMNFAYQESIRLTGSEIGFMGFLNHDGTILETPCYPSKTMELCDIAVKKLFSPIKDGGLWAQTVRQCRPIIVNDYKADNPHKKGLPAGHIKLTRFLAVPVLDGNRVVSVIAVGNKPDDYDESDVYQLQLFAGGLCDILKRREAEEKLRISEEKFSKAFHSSPVMMSINRLKDGYYFEANNAFFATLGFKREEVIGRCLNEIRLWPVEHAICIYRKLKEKGRLYNYEQDARTKDGGIINGILSAEIITFNGEQCVIATMVDIAGRRRAEGMLRHSEERFYKIFHNSPDMIAIIRMGDSKYVEANRRFCNVLEYKREELLNRTPKELKILTRENNIKKSYCSYLREQKKVQNFELNIRTKTGKLVTILISGEIINLNGEICSLSIMKDITKEKKMEAEIAHLDRLNLVGEMAASIGHEIRNPMTTVRGYLQLLGAKKDLEKYADRFELMINEIDRANSIITNFLSLAKNKMVDLKPLNINKVVEKMLPLIEAEGIVSDKYIKLHLQEIPDLLLDEKELCQLLLNLSKNGFEAMEPGGELTIKTYIQDSDVILAIRDQGTGISPDILDKIGTPFFTTKDQGNGIGMAVCYAIANKHNGKIEIDTGISGTTILVRFKFNLG